MLSTILTTSLGGNVLPNRRIDVIAERSRFFDAGPGVRPYVNFELAGVNGREKVLRQETASECRPKPIAKTINRIRNAPA